MDTIAAPTPFTLLVIPHHTVTLTVVMFDQITKEVLY